MLKFSVEIMDMMKFLARELGCGTIRCTVTRQGLVAHYQRKLDFQIESVNMVTEV